MQHQTGALFQGRLSEMARLLRPSILLTLGFPLVMAVLQGPAEAQLVREVAPAPQTATNPNNSKGTANLGKMRVSQEVQLTGNQSWTYRFVFSSRVGRPCRTI